MIMLMIIKCAVETGSIGGLYPFDFFTFHEEDEPGREALNRYFDQEDIEVVINLRIFKYYGSLRVKNLKLGGLAP